MKGDFPVVCVGGSAGGPGAYVTFLKHMPVDLGVAIVVVNHVTSKPTTLHKYLSKFTEMPVELITNNSPIKLNHVFIIPANCDLHVLNGEFILVAKTKPSGWPDVITVFLRSVTQHWGGLLIAVIVSGFDDDGAKALKEVRERGGIIMAQAPDTAEWSDMPESAIKTGFVDFVLPMEAIAQKITQIMTERLDQQLLARQPST